MQDHILRPLLYNLHENDMVTTPVYEVTVSRRNQNTCRIISYGRSFITSMRMIWLLPPFMRVRPLFLAILIDPIVLTRFHADCLIVLKISTYGNMFAFSWLSASSSQVKA